MVKFNTIRDFFSFLNDRCTYLILRNWDDVFNEGIYGDAHEDIDILCDDLEAFKRLTDIQNLHNRIDRDNYVVIIGDSMVRVDVRHVGDEYYPAAWQILMLQRRVRQGDIFIMGKEDYAYSLMYHALLQKPSLTEEYKTKIIEAFQENLNGSPVTEKEFLEKLKAFLRVNQFDVSIPSDPGVYLNWKNLKYVGYKCNINNIMRRSFFRISKVIMRLCRISR